MGCACAKEKIEPPEDSLPIVAAKAAPRGSKTPQPRTNQPRRRSALVTNTPAPEVIHRLTEPLANLYDVQEVLSEDESGQIARAKHRKLGQPCFVKTMPKESGRSLLIQKEKLLIEMERLMQLDHPHVLKTYEVAQDDHNFYLVTEPFVHIDLADARFRSEAFLAQVMHQVFWALNYCHQQGIVHGRLSLHNLVWQDSVQSPQTKVLLTGFGDLDSLHSADHTHYQAPEPTEEFGPKADIWSSGVILYTLLSGEPPFSDQQHASPRFKKYSLSFPTDRWEGYSQEVVSLIASMLEIDPKVRFSAALCRTHPWVAQYVKLPSIKSSTNIKTLFTLRKLHHLNPFQFTISKFVLMRVMTGQDIEPLEEAFSALDRDGDGVLLAKELLQDFLRVMPESDALGSAKKVIEGGYHSESGGMTYTEFLVAVFGEKRLLSASNLRTVFSCFERGSSRFASLQELRNFFFARTTPQQELQWRRLLLQVDVPGEDLINFGTFSAMLASTDFA